MGRRCKNQVWDGRTNVVTVAPAEPSWTQSAETAMIISRLLIIALGILWLLLLLIIGGAFGVDAASVPQQGADHIASPALAVASLAPGGGGGGGGIQASRRALDVDGMTSLRMSLLEEGLGWHQRGRFEEAAQVYSTLLKAIPEDPDGLHLLGLAQYSQGKILRESPGRAKESNALFEEAERLVRSAISVAVSSQQTTLSMRTNLGEVLRAKGDYEEAEAILRRVMREQQEAGFRDDQASFNLAVTLVERIRQADVSPRSPTIHSEDRPDNAGRGDQGRSAGDEMWEIRAEAERLLLRELSKRPDDTKAMLELVALFNSNWDLAHEYSAYGNSERSGAYNAEGGIFFDEEGNIIYGIFDDGDASIDGQEWNTQQRDWGGEALFWLDRVISLRPSDAAVALERAVALHRLGRIEAARAEYTQVVNMEGAEVDGTRHFARSNLAALKQESGDAAGSITIYREVLAESPENSIVLNNLGAALLSLDEHDEGVAMLEKSLQLDPLNPGVMVNLGTHWQEEGDLDLARSLYTSAERLRRNDGLPVRRALMLPPIMGGEQEILREREELMAALDDLIEREPPLFIPDPTRAVERVHFYLIYRGGNHRTTQEKIARMYTQASPGLLHVAPFLKTECGHIEPHTSSSVVDASTSNMIEATAGRAEGPSGKYTGPAASKVRPAGIPQDAQRHPCAAPSSGSSAEPTPLRVGFVSKFFGDQEPHGMLLDGIIRHLPRTHFYITVCPIDAPGKPLSPHLKNAADAVVELPMKLEAARNILGGLRLDVLVYADMNSEPTSHFLGYSRLAKVQAVFWGNPITTGNPSIDFFLSADVMEAKHRTTLSEEDEPYSEQVVLLGGQGIWYNRPVLPMGLSDIGREGTASTQSRESTKAALRQELKSRLGVEEDSVIFMCPQSLFKLKPDFDLVLRDIHSAFGNSNSSNQKTSRKAYLVLTEGRRKRWTTAFWRRLKDSVPEMIPQVRMLPRTSAGREFYRLLASADVILHPFPFGGSKTAADGLAVGVPVVAMEGDALPGRMAFSLYKTMGLEGPAGLGCCVAKDRDSYVQLAVRLGRDAHFREWAGDLIGQRSSVLWDRREVVLEWARFLSRAAGRPSPAAHEVGLAADKDIVLLPPEPFQEDLQWVDRQHQHQHQHQNQQGFRTPLKVVVEEELVKQPPPLEGGVRRDSPSHVLKSPALHISTGVSAPGATFPAADTTVEGHHPREEEAADRDLDREESKVLTSHLVGKFEVLYREGRLEEAAAILQQTLGIMEEARTRSNNKRVASGAARTEKDHAAYGDPVMKRALHREGHYGGIELEEEGNASAGSIVVGQELKLDGDSHSESAAIEEASAIAGVMNDLGCTLQQLWRLEEAEAFLRGAIENRPGYFSAMNALGVTLQAKNQLEEAESWYREALRLSPQEARDHALANLVLLMRAEGGRLHEAVDLLIRETSTPPLHRGGAIVAALSLLQPRSTHKQTFRRLGDGEGWSTRFGPLPELWEEVSRLRELYPRSTNNLVVFLGLLGKLEGVQDVMKHVAGMEPLFFPEDEEFLLPPELHRSSRTIDSRVSLDSEAGTGTVNQSMITDVSFEDDTSSSRINDSGSGSGGGVGGETGSAEEEGRRRRWRRLQQRLLYDRSSVHVVTQYYVPDDPHRAREIDYCLLGNLRNPFVGTVHLITDHTDAVGQFETAMAVEENGVFWVETDWRPPILRGLAEEIAGKARVVTLPRGRRATFRDAIRYSNYVLNNQVVLLSNSDIVFDESLVRLGDPSTLDMAQKVFALAPWQSNLVSAHNADRLGSGENVDDTYEIYEAVLAEPKFAPRTDSQDAWIFRSPLSSTVADTTDFEMGRPSTHGRVRPWLLAARLLPRRRSTAEIQLTMLMYQTVDRRYHNPWVDLRRSIPRHRGVDRYRTLGPQLSDVYHAETSACRLLLAPHRRTSIISSFARCDGRLAQVLLDAGYSVTSPSLGLVACHVHASARSRSVSLHPGASATSKNSSSSSSTYRMDTQVVGETASVPISDQWLF